MTTDCKMFIFCVAYGMLAIGVFAGVFIGWRNRS